MPSSAACSLKAACRQCIRLVRWYSDSVTYLCRAKLLTCRVLGFDLKHHQNTFAAIGKALRNAASKACSRLLSSPGKHVVTYSLRKEGEVRFPEL